VITEAELAHWRTKVPWILDAQVEQDLVLSRLIIEIAQDPLLGQELVFRGGTCFHKLWLDRPWRYSEDLDYVRQSDGGVGEILDSIRTVAESVGIEKVSTQIGRHPKVRLKFDSVFGSPLQIKIEMNTYERSPARPIVHRGFSVTSPWFRGAAEVPSFALEELTATKIRALFERRKGRDLFDLWLAVHVAGAEIADIAKCFWPYRPDRWDVSRALDNLETKLLMSDFIQDLNLLVDSGPPDYSITAAAEIARAVIKEVDRCT
jgi:predicted nucleotidyltransferase component of viral defense system